jgi:hypothetical protein
LDQKDGTRETREFRVLRLQLKTNDKETLQQCINYIYCGLKCINNYFEITHKNCRIKIQDEFTKLVDRIDAIPENKKVTNSSLIKEVIVTLLEGKFDYSVRTVMDNYGSGIIRTKSTSSSSSTLTSSDQSELVKKILELHPENLKLQQEILKLKKELENEKNESNKRKKEETPDEKQSKQRKDEKSKDDKSNKEKYKDGESSAGWDQQDVNKQSTPTISPTLAKFLQDLEVIDEDDINSTSLVNAFYDST